jgi:MFS family permease
MVDHTTEKIVQEAVSTLSTATLSPAGVEDGSAEKTSAVVSRENISQTTLTGQANEEKQSPQQTTPGSQDYSVYTTNQKRMIVLVASFAGFFSPLTGTIYYPAITTIADSLGVSNNKINLTVTTYTIVQGLAPMMIAGFSDNVGRRPAYMICFTIYLAANLGLGLQNQYIALLLIRMLQSGGSSGTIALAQGVTGDVVTSSERGAYIAFASVSSILGPSLSPILGGVLSQYLGWHSVFWFLLILAGCFCVPLFLFLPETCRKVVGSGMVPPPPLNMSLTDKIRFANRARAGIEVDQAEQARLRRNYRMRFPNPFSTLVVLFHLESFLILFSCGLGFSCFYAISTGASAAFKTVYGFDELHVSLMFLPFGLGGIISAFTTGQLMDWNYRRHARRLNFPVVKNRQTDLINFPIERARIEIALPTLLLGALGVVGYGWMMGTKVSIAGPVVLLFLLGYGLTASFQTLNALMIDIHSTKPAAATAAANIVRCELGSAATAAIGPMIQAMGTGWSYTLLGLLTMGSLPLLCWVMLSGMEWRQEERARADEKERKTGALSMEDR